MENRTIQERKEQFFQQMMLEKGKQISTCKKINLEPNLTLHKQLTKKKKKIIDLNTSARKIKFLKHRSNSL